VVSEKRPVSPRELNTSSVEMWWKRKAAWRSLGRASQWARTACSSWKVPFTLLVMLTQSGELVEQ
jgi:hypothetical protein